MKKTRDELKDLRQFGITLSLILILLGAIHFVRHRMVISQWFFSIGLIVLCLSALKPVLLRSVYAVFLKIAHAIGWFNTRVILIVIFFVVVTPISVIIRIFGKDPLNRKIDKGAPTYWTKRQKESSVRTSLERQF